MSKIAILIEALNKIELGDYHDEMCVSDSGTRMDDCTADHRCYCASRLALDALVKAKAREI